ncbi:hypothetical protein [Lewinella sp. 4G2]|uniref:hypothetical protein n=1 Tax=Lewinella sp. 4G2 TaxID=1803372 RepID=UPI0007B47194|nr:hypothetical protein [Lewinella sp. 4G2]OAV45174.1 hypothetical protein A3850_012025 [Lewinella sp. 4G2]
MPSDPINSFDERLRGGHPNSLGNTVEIVDEVLADQALFSDLFDCYFSDDETVRLRVSNAIKRIGKEDKSLLIPYIDRLLEDVSLIDQASTQWTLSQLFLLLQKDLNEDQRTAAIGLMKHNLETHTDWIVLSQTMNTLAEWAKKDEDLKAYLIPQLERQVEDERKSVSGRAGKLLAKLS